MTDDLNVYLTDAGRRLKHRLAARGAAATALATLGLTLLTAAALVTFVPASAWVLGARIILYLMLVLAVVAILRTRFTRRRSAEVLEEMIPAFDGRLCTWNDADQRRENTPLLGLLARDAEGIARNAPVTTAIPARTILLPSVVAGIAAAAFLWLLGAGPGSPSPLQLSALRLWTGELFMAAAPRITVSPGDTVVPRGSDVVIEASATGFAASAMQLHAEFDGTAGWETAPMARLGDGRYGFVFVGVNEQVSYYAGAAGINSERHVIRVADLPRVTDVVLEYRYPDWTELPATERRDGDIAALPGTGIGVTASTDVPVADPLLVVNGEVISADADGNLTLGSFEVGEPGSWHVAVRHEGILARISDSFLIDVVSDQPPEIAFSWPGHDVQATAIEEWTLRFAAADDYGLRSLTFHYAVNGGGWIESELPLPDEGRKTSGDSASTSEYTLYLEDLEAAPLPPEGAGRPLRAGDMISFYAEARDHAQETRTALYFIDVRPYDRTYRESQSMAGQGGQGGGADELVQRQREIVTATWNLINRRSRGEGEPGDEDQAEVLALLQRTLADQVTTLIERATARRLMLDEEIDTFTRELTSATEDMIPAAEQLERQDLEAAVSPAQQALQHLLAAQATVNDVDVSMGSADMRGTAGRSLSELMDLEMDQERNRYETPQSPSGGNEAQSESEEWQQLKALADRQEAIARQQRLGEESLASRWQQERLQRELERLQEALERRQRQAEQQSRARQGTSNGNQQNQQNQQNQERLDNAISELARAQESIRQSLDRPQADASASRQATEAIRRAADELREEAAGQLDERLNRNEQMVQNLLADQRAIMRRLDEVRDDALTSRNGTTRRFDDYVMEPYAERKRRMQADLNDLSRELDALGDVVEDGDTAAVLAEASRELADERLDERLAASADAFQFGRPLYAIDNEATVERALERLAGRLDQARRQLAASGGQSRESSTLTQVRELRAELDALGTGNNRDMESLLRRTDALEARLSQEIGADVALDTTFSRQAYQELGIDAANTEALARLMSDRLDLLEAALVNLDAEPIRAQEPRDQARDSDAAARYFEELSRP